MNLEMTHAERYKNPNSKTAVHDADIINWVTQPCNPDSEFIKCCRQGQLVRCAYSLPNRPLLFMVGLFYNEKLL